MKITEGSKLGRYEIRSLIGVGGMGEVYRATDPKIGRDVAIKVLPADFSADHERVIRFEQEAQAAGALNHPNILAIHDVDTQDNVLYVVSELLEGEELRQLLDAGPIPPRKAVDYAQQIVSGLAAAHAKGIVHRDLKPENLFITTDDRVKILDFGLAKLRAATPQAGGSEDETRRVLTNPGVVMGTVGYMSPEQVRGQMVDHRSDIFSFGVILYEMITGRRAFQEESLAETMSAIVKEEPPEITESNPNISPALERIVRRCLEKKAERRSQRASDLEFALESLSAPTSSSGGNMTTPAPAKPSFWNRFGPAFAALSVLTLLGLVIAGIALWRTPRAEGRAGQIRSLAVLPFTFETQDPKLSGLGKWIPAEIRSKLGPLQNLQVVNSPARIEQLVQQKKSEVEIARDLGVDGLVMGELHGQGETMSAYVWVVDGATGRALGRQREIATSAAKVSEIPNQVALAIVDELKLQVSTSQRTEIQVADTQNAEAFLAYQKGRRRGQA